MSRFVFLYREARTPTPQELQGRMAKTLAWFEDLEKKGHLAVYGHPLNRTDGRVVKKGQVTDGPYAETKDIVIGFSVIEAKDLDEAVRLALMLNVSCGFGAEEIARVHLTSTSAVEKRIARGKKVLAGARRLFELTEDDVEPRLAAVQRALYVLFSEGYHGACDDAPIREELCREALRLARLLVDHVQVGTPTSCALAALMYLHAARLGGRVSEVGELLALAEQDRSRWDAKLIAEGLALLEHASTGTEVSRFHVEATIAGLHATAPSVEETPWAKIVELYDLVMRIAPSPVDVARPCFEAAIRLARSDAERRFLLRRLAACSN